MGIFDKFRRKPKESSVPKDEEKKLSDSTETNEISDKGVLAPEENCLPPKTTPKERIGVKLDNNPIDISISLVAQNNLTGLQPDEKAEKTGLWSRLKKGFQKTSSQLNQGLSQVFSKKNLDKEALEELEDLLIMSDMGPNVAQDIVKFISKQKLDKSIDTGEARALIASYIEEKLTPYERAIEIDILKKPSNPCVILVVGVNGAGKTTTIGKLTKTFKDNNKNVHLVAGDTFRAAAVEQLSIWAQRMNVPIYKADSMAGKTSDPAALVYDSYQQAAIAGADILMIDTAGRLHTKTDLMAELEKIIRVIKKIAPEAPHHTLLVLDSTIGQNAILQLETFKKVANITGLVVTKLDGTAKGGIVIQLASTFELPIHYIGVGESIEDLQPFSAKSFAKSLVDID